MCHLGNLVGMLDRYATTGGHTFFVESGCRYRRRRCSPFTCCLLPVCVVDARRYLYEKPLSRDLWEPRFGGLQRCLCRRQFMSIACIGGWGLMHV